jgi:hypothetical protein
MSKKNKNQPAKPKLPRTKRVAFMLTEEEENAMKVYLNKYKITNRSRWIRETALAHILKVYDDDYPTLFSENEMRR